MKRSIRLRRKTELLALSFLGVLWFGSSPAVHSQDERPQLHKRTIQFSGLLSSSQMDPPLRATAYVRFSPDGRYVLMQDPVGVFVFETNPLAPRLFLESNSSYPARFSADSKSLILLSRSLLMGKWALPTGKKLDEQQLSIGDGCLKAALSPDGSLLACYRSDLVLGIYRTESGQQVAAFPIHKLGGEEPRVIVSLDAKMAYGGIFGNIVTTGFGALANRDEFGFEICFSPDGGSLAAGDGRNAVYVDTGSFTKKRISGSVEKRLLNLAGLQDSSTGLFVSAEPKESAATVSLDSGEIAGRPALPNMPASEVTLASNSRYALMTDPQTETVSVYDLQANHAIATPPAIGADIRGEMLAVLSEDGDIAIYNLGDTTPLQETKDPANDLSLLRSAAVSPSLDKIALAVDGQGAIFDVASGKRLVRLARFATASLEDPAAAYASTFSAKEQVFEAQRFEYGGQKPAPVWSTERFSVPHENGGLILNYVPYNPFGSGFFVNSSQMYAFELHGLDPVTGRKAWSRTFSMTSPVPFANPQGSNFVLGWDAADDRARDIASKFPAAKAAYKHGKVAGQDSLFEICDALTGKTIGAVLVQFGGGAHTFDQAFAAGDRLILVKDQLRVTLFSISRNEMIARLSGGLATASAESNLLVLEEAPGILAVCDLTTGKELTELRFKEQIVFARFSADGHRLLALSEQQGAYVLDMGSILKGSKVTDSN